MAWRLDPICCSLLFLALCISTPFSLSDRPLLTPSSSLLSSDGPFLPASTSASVSRPECKATSSRPVGLLSPTLPSLFLLAALLFSSRLVHLLEQVFELPYPLERELPRVRGLPTLPLALTATLLPAASLVSSLSSLGTLALGPRSSGDYWLDVQGYSPSASTSPHSRQLTLRQRALLPNRQGSLLLPGTLVFTKSLSWLCRHLVGSGAGWPSSLWLSSVAFGSVCPSVPTSSHF